MDDDTMLENGLTYNQIALYSPAIKDLEDIQVSKFTISMVFHNVFDQTLLSKNNIISTEYN